MIRLLAILLFSFTAFAQSADLYVAYSDLGQPRLLFTLFNQGPDVARNVRLEMELPPPLGFDRNHDDGRSQCKLAGTRLRCDSGDVAPYPDARSFDIALTAPEVDATYTVTATITSDTPDPNPSNNLISQTFTIRVQADLNVRINPERVRVDPDALQVFDVEVANYYNVISPRDIRLTFTAQNGVIENIEAEPRWTCTISGATAECGADILEENCWCGGKMLISVRPSGDRAGGETTITAHASSNLPERWDGNDAATATIETYRHLIVSTTADAGEGSLRGAIEEANRSCTPGPCKIVFEMPPPAPAEGWFTIVPVEPLPPVTADRVFIDGAWQTTFGGDTNANGPEIAIDGHLAHHGLEIHSACEAIVRGIAFGNFDANQGLWLSQSRQCSEWPDRRGVFANFLGVAPDGTTPWPNLRGLRLDDAGFARVSGNTIAHNRRSGVWMWRGMAVNFDRNRIERNGASGIFLGPEVSVSEVLANTISGHPEMGVAVARGAAEIDIRQNSMRGNGGLGIDWGLDGVSPANADDSPPRAPSNAPVLLSARYDAATNQTVVTVSLKSAPLNLYGNGWLIDVYANDAPDGDGEQWLSGQLTYVRASDGPFTVSVTGNLIGKWLNAMSTRIHFYASRPGGPSTNSYGGAQANTSELSNAVKVE